MKKLLRLLVIILLAIPSFSFAAISGSAIWNIQNTATAGNVNGGFFVTGASGVDYSVQDAAQFALTSVACAGAGNTVTHVSAATTMVGNGAKVVSGTNMTASWFEVTSVNAGVDITFSTNAAGTSICTGVSANGVVNIGGSLSLESTLDDDAFEAGAAGNMYCIKKFSGGDGEYDLGETVAITLAGTTASPIRLVGYQTTCGDRPLLANMPKVDGGAAATTLGANYSFSYIDIKSTGTSVLIGGTNAMVNNCKVTNTSTTDNLHALNGVAVTENCELVSYRGNSFVFAGGGLYRFFNNNSHHSNIGITDSGSGTKMIIGNIFANHVTQALVQSSASQILTEIRDNTLYGAENQLGDAIDLISGAALFTMNGNICYGFVLCIDGKDATNSLFENYNAFYANGTNMQNVNSGGSSVTAINPAFASVTQITGTGASSLTNVLTSSGADFSSVVDNVDFVYLKSGSGTGFAARNFLITAHDDTADTLTLSSNITSSGAGSAIVWQVTLGNNFLPTGAL